MSSHNGPVVMATGRPLPGLSGSAYYQHTDTQAYVWRQVPDKHIPFIDRGREYRIMQRLAKHHLAARPLIFTRQGLGVRWLDGKSLDEAQFCPSNPSLIQLFSQLHHQPLFGYTLKLLPLLIRYWQLSQNKNYIWYQALHRLKRVGEPKPLRYVPLHRDIHPGNIIQTASGLCLIDWEYAADGDIALDIATICLQNPAQHYHWVQQFAEMYQINNDRLDQQIMAWKPWLKLLAASWYQLRSEQTAEPKLQQLARISWQQLKE